LRRCGLRLLRGRVHPVLMILLALITCGHSPPMRAEVDPAMWWYVARASGLIALALLATSVVGGQLLSAHPTRHSTRTWIHGLHEFIGALAVVFTAMQLTSLLAATQLHLGLRELLVPFTRPENPVAKGCGVPSFYLSPWR